MFDLSMALRCVLVETGESSESCKAIYRCRSRTFVEGRKEWEGVGGDKREGNKRTQRDERREMKMEDEK